MSRDSHWKNYEYTEITTSKDAILKSKYNKGSHPDAQEAFFAEEFATQKSFKTKYDY